MEEFVMAAVADKEECRTRVGECSHEAITTDDKIAVIDADKWTECCSCIDVYPSEAMSSEG
ncbi:MAG: hypothetical protein APR56_08230 [Methanosaeta sp. SDB]|nr:MAG: hypothetical protein APR56_08230 [Methanosaeta sp. SDB]